MNIIVHGGIAAGKSTIARYLANKPELLAKYISIDEIVKSIYSELHMLDQSNNIFRYNGKEVVRSLCMKTHQIYNEFNKLYSTLTHYFKTINKNEISNVIFQQPLWRELVESAFAPLIKLRLEELMKSETTTYIIEFPLYAKSNLSEIGLSKHNLVIGVISLKKNKIERVKSRNAIQISEEKINSIIKAQPSNLEVTVASDIIIHNDYESKEKLEIYIDKFLLPKIKNALINKLKVYITGDPNTPFSEKAINDLNTLNSLNDSIGTDLKSSIPEFYQDNLITHNHPNKSSCQELSGNRPALNKATPKLKIGIISGGFDPITQGDIWLISQALSLMDTVYIVISTNDTEQYHFSLLDRMSMINRSLQSEMAKDQIDKIKVVSLQENKLLISYANELKADFIFRGIRSAKDYEYEKDVYDLQKNIHYNIESIFLIPPEHLINISSSKVKMLRNYTDCHTILEKQVPANVYRMLIEQ